MTSSNAFWTAPSLQQYRFPVIAAACLVAGAALYYTQNLYSESRDFKAGLHRSNAGRRRRQRQRHSSGINRQPDQYGEARESLNTADQPDRPPPLGVAETDADGVSEFSWQGEDEEEKENNAQGLLLLLYKIAEDRSRRDGYVHRGVTCNGCSENPIRGIRYRCANCSDYDLCETCEAAHTHNREHVFWKIRIPAPHIGGLRKERLPVFYPGKPTATIQDMDREHIKDLCKATGYKEEEVEAFWEQFRSMAAAEYPDDPDDYGLAIDRTAFEQCFVPSSSSCPPTPNLLYDRIFSYYDSNNDGLIGFGEFIKGLASLKRNNASERLKRVFKAYDMNNDGYVDRRDFLRIFRAYYSLTKFFVSDMVTAMHEDDDGEQEDAQALVSSSQPLTSGFSGPGIMNRAQLPQNRVGKALNVFGDAKITDGMGVINDRKPDSRSELTSMIAENAERRAHWKRGMYLGPEFCWSGKSIYDLVFVLDHDEIRTMLDPLGDHAFSSRSNINAENPETWQRRQLQGHLAMELLCRYSTRRMAINERGRREPYYQNGDVTWLSADIIETPEVGGSRADPRVHTQMQKDYREIQTTELVSELKKDVDQLVESYGWPIANSQDFAHTILAMVECGWRQEEMGHGLDGFSPDPAQVLSFVKRLAQLLAERVSQAQSEPGFERDHLAPPHISKKAPLLRLADKRWSCPTDDTKLEPNNGQDVLLSVTEEALNELLDPVFQLREDLALLAMFERPRRTIHRDKIRTLLNKTKRSVVHRKILELYCRTWRQKNGPPPLPMASLAAEAGSFLAFLRAMLSSEPIGTEGSSCAECLIRGYVSWVRFGENCSHTERHSKSSEEGLYKEGQCALETTLDPELCENCLRKGDEYWISEPYCEECLYPHSQVAEEETRYSIATGGRSLLFDSTHSERKDLLKKAFHNGPRSSLSRPVQNRGEAAQSSDGNSVSQQEGARNSMSGHMFSSQPGSPKSLCDGTPLEVDDGDEKLLGPSSNRINLDSSNPLPKEPSMPKNSREEQIVPTSSKPRSISPISESQRPDPTLPQNRPTTAAPHETPSSIPPPPSPAPPPLANASPHPSSKNTTAHGQPRKRLTKHSLLSSVDLIRSNGPEMFSNAMINYYMCLDILVADDQERGGPGRINFEEFEEIMQGEKGPGLGFLASWVEIGAF